MNTLPRSLRVLELTMTEFAAVAFNNRAAVTMASPMAVLIVSNKD